VKSKPLMLLIISLIFVFVPYWIFVGMAPLLYIKDLKVSLAHFGYYQGLLAFVFAMGSIMFGLMMRRIDFNQKKLINISLWVTVMSLIIIVMVACADSKNPLLITLTFLPFIIGQIIPSVILYPLSVNFLPQVKGRVSAVMQGGKLMLTAVGLQLAGYFYQGSFRSVAMVLIGFILIAVITMFYIVKNDRLISRLA
jgi:DHA1 family bicyclomycin/chloramphenicol resistance-like MFS transporter